MALLGRDQVIRTWPLKNIPLLCLEKLLEMFPGKVWKSEIWKWLAPCEAVFLNYGKNILIIQSFRLLGITELANSFLLFENEPEF